MSQNNDLNELQDQGLIFNTDYIDLTEKLKNIEVNYYEEVKSTKALIRNNIRFAT